MRTIIKLTIVLGLILQGSPKNSFSYGGFVWREDVQEDVHLQTVTYRVGHPWIYLEVVETEECGHLWKGVISKTMTVRPLMVTVSVGFWLAFLWLLERSLWLLDRGLAHEDWGDNK